MLIADPIRKGREQTGIRLSIDIYIRSDSHGEPNKHKKAEIRFGLFVYMTDLI